MPNVTRGFAPLGVPLVEIAPATLVGLFRWSMSPGLQQYLQPGHAHDGEQVWMLYTRSVMSASITCDGAEGATLIIEIGSDPAPGDSSPVMQDWLPVCIPGSGLPMIITGLELPGLVARFRLESAGAGFPVVHGSIIVRGV